MSKNKKILIIGAFSGFLASLAAQNIKSWSFSLLTALVIGAIVGLIGINIMSD